MELNVGSIQGLSPTFRVTLNADTTLELESDFNVSSQQYIPFPSGTDAQRHPDPLQGSMRFNTTSTKLEVWSGTDWVAL